MKKRVKYFLLALLVGFLVQWLLSSCQSPEHHHWDSCDIKEVEAQNIAPTSEQDLQGPSFDEIIIDFDDNLSKEEIKSFGDSVGLTLMFNSEHSESSNLCVATVPEGSVPYIKAHIYQHGFADKVDSVEENFKIEALAWEPDDPLYQFQWNMAQVEAVESWTMASGKGVVVSVIDTGVALGEDKSRNIIPVRDLKETDQTQGYDFVDDDPFPWDGHGHGTHVAGTIAQSTDNSYGVSGLAYNATIMPIRVLNSNGSGTAADIADGIRFSAENGADVINMSLGSSRPSSIIEEAVNYAHKNGVTVVAAAGNSGNRSPGYPAAFDNVIAVASTQYDKHPAFYSQWGPFIDIAAPGGNTKVDQNGDGKPDGILQETVKPSEPDNHFFALFMGTSMASPHVAAVAAQVQEWGVTHPDAVEKVLKKTSDKSMLAQNNDSDSKDGDDDEDENSDLYDEKEFKDRYGSGILQADSAVTTAIMDPGLLRALLAFLLAAGMFFVARGKSFLEADAKKVTLYMGSSVVVASGFFLLPFFIPYMEVPQVAAVVKVLATPIPKWDWAVLGITQTPIMASFLIPLGVVALLNGTKFFKYLGVGVSIGFAAFCLAEAIMLTMPLMWIPGGDLAMRAYLAVMAISNLVLTYYALKK